MFLCFSALAANVSSKYHNSRTMKHHILPLLFLLPLTATAQGIHHKFGGGLSSHYGSDQVIGAFKIGIGYEVELTQHWSFTPGIEVYG